MNHIRQIITTSTTLRPDEIGSVLDFVDLRWSAAKFLSPEEEDAAICLTNERKMPRDPWSGVTRFDGTIWRRMTNDASSRLVIIIRLVVPLVSTSICIYVPPQQCIKNSSYLYSRSCSAIHTGDHQPKPIYSLDIVMGEFNSASTRFWLTDPGTNDFATNNAFDILCCDLDSTSEYCWSLRDNHRFNQLWWRELQKTRRIQVQWFVSN